MILLNWHILHSKIITIYTKSILEFPERAIFDHFLSHSEQTGSVTHKKYIH